MPGTPGRTHKATEAFNARFNSPQEKSDYFRGLAQRSAASRLTLSAEERTALTSAYKLLATIAARHNLDTLNEPVEIG